VERDSRARNGEDHTITLNMSQEQVLPPRWPLRVLRFFIRKSYLEEIEGDLEEEFYDNLASMPVAKARRRYSWDVLKLLRPVLLRNFAGVRFHSAQAMYLNYFKVSYRGLMKNPLNSVINVFGLAAAIGIAIFGYAFARWTYSTDQFHKLKDEVYLVTFFTQRDGTDQQFGTTPQPLGEMLRQDLPVISKVCRVEDKQVVVKHADNIYHQRVRFTDPEFLEIFTFPLKWGTPASLKDVNSIILSEDMSEKYFGEANPVGLDILVYFDKDNSKSFKVTGVAAAFPKSKTISFDFLANLQNMRQADPAYDDHNWGAFFNATLIQVPNRADLPIVQDAMSKYKDIHNEAVKDEWAISSFALQPLATLHEHSSDIRDDISRSSDSNYATIVYLIFVCFLLLTLACINYINIAIVTTAKRLKEIGVRKSIGASRKVVIIQFLTENVVVTSLALILGMILAVSIFIPGFESMWDFDMDFSFTDLKLWIYLPLLLLFVSLSSGFYPAIYISRFQVVNILKGSLRFGRKSPLTKVFLCLELIVACIFITTAIMFSQNTSYLNKRSWGYDQAHAIYAVLPDARSHEQLSTTMAQLPNVQSLSGSKNHVGRSHATTVLIFPDREYEVDELAVDAQYFETMGIPLKEGRPFQAHENSDRHAVVVNELMVANMGWEEPIGQTFRIDSASYEVIGVVYDFHNYSFSKVVRPIVFRVAEKEDYKYLSLRVADGTEIDSYKKLQDNWMALFPDVPFEGGLQEDVWGFYFEQISIYSIVWRVLSTLAITLACLGLYGLISLNVEGRVRELSLRKVLGASAAHITQTVSRQYYLLFTIAIIIGGPLGYYVSTMIIHSAYSYHMPFTYSGVVMALTLLTAIILATVLMQVMKVQKANPVEGLKIE
jgi:putative ABC transport system permease protein